MFCCLLCVCLHRSPRLPLVICHCEASVVVVHTTPRSVGNEVSLTCQSTLFVCARVPAD